MPWGSIIASVAGSVISGAMSSDAAGDASDAQSQSAAAGIEEQRRQFDLNRKDSAQYRQSGQAANKRLAYLLGLDLGSQPWEPGGVTPEGADDLTTWARRVGYNTPAGRAWDAAETANLTPGYQAYLKTLPQKSGADQASDPQYGSLLRKFTAADLEADPVYKAGLEFGLREGEGAINARALAGGSYDSGATLKALTRFANDYGSTKANEARNRYVSDQDSIYNRLAGISGTGQTATAQTMAANTGISNNISNLMGDAGNARAAGIVGAGNAWSNAINSGYNNYQSSRIYDALTKKKSPYQTPPYNPDAYGYYYDSRDG